MSFDTTANPRPESPVRAASTEPLTASMLVCTVINAIALTILSILRPTVSSRPTVATLACVLCSALLTPLTSASTEARLFLRSRFHRPHALVRGLAVLLRKLRAFFDLRQRCRCLLGGRRLQLTGAIDLLRQRP